MQRNPCQSRNHGELSHGTLARCLRNAMETMSMDLAPIVKPKKPSCTQLPFSCSSKVPQAGTIETRSCLHYAREIAEAPSYCECPTAQPRCWVSPEPLAHTGSWVSPEPQASRRSWTSSSPQSETGLVLGQFRGFIYSCLFWVFLVLQDDCQYDCCQYE